MNPTDGPAYAATGIPLPYERYSGVASIEYFFMPHVYLFNLIVLSLLVYPAVRRAVDSRFFLQAPRRRVFAGAAGAGLLLLVSAWVLFLVDVGGLRAVSSIGDESYGRFSEFRPVGIQWVGSASLDCTPSPYWFPNGWPPPLGQ